MIFLYNLYICRTVMKKSACILFLFLILSATHLCFAGEFSGSMLQLMPEEGGMFDIDKRGYYPEVVQHTKWDYGRNGKGFYNDIFAPEWSVASLWQMLSPERVDKFFSKN